MWSTKIFLVLFALCAVLVKATEIDDAVCSQIFEGSTAEYDDDGAFVGCLEPDDYDEDEFDENNFSAGYAFECEGDEFIDPKNGTPQCCPANTYFQTDPYFPEEGGCCSVGEVYGWDVDYQEFSCQSPLTSEGAGQQALGDPVPGYPRPNPGNPNPPPPYPGRPSNPNPPSKPAPRPNPNPPSNPAPKPSPPKKDLTCPSANNMFKVVDGVVYKLLCNRGWSTRGRFLRRVYVNRALDCLAACSADRRCNAANWWWRTGTCSMATGRIYLGRPRGNPVMGAFVRGHTDD